MSSNLTTSPVTEAVKDTLVRDRYGCHPDIAEEAGTRIARMAKVGPVPWIEVEAAVIDACDETDERTGHCRTIGPDESARITNAIIARCGDTIAVI